MAINCSTCAYEGQPLDKTPCEVCERLGNGQRGIIYTRHKAKGKHHGKE